MYESFYGFSEKPFDLTPDPAYLFMSPGHSNTYAHLEYAIMENKGFGVITGEIGSGKTTLINYLLNNMRKDIDVGLVNDTDLHPEDFLKIICQEFELDIEGMNRADMLGSFRRYLLSRFAEKRRVILIIDEAQNLSSRTIIELNIGFVSNFCPTKVGNMSDIGGNTVNLRKSMKIVKKNFEF